MSVDVKLTQAHDIMLKDGKLVLITGATKRAQQIKMMLLTFLGEWQFDTSAGVPYLERVLLKSPNFSKLSALFRQKIVSVEGVVKLTEFELQYSRAERVLTITFTAETDEGKVADTIKIGVNQ